MCHLYLGHLLLPEQVCILNTHLVILGASRPRLQHLMITDVINIFTRNVHNHVRQLKCPLMRNIKGQA